MKGKIFNAQKIDEKRRLFLQNPELFGKHEKVETGRCLECGKALIADKYVFEGESLVKNPETCVHIINN